MRAVIQRVAQARICAERLYRHFSQRLRDAGIKVANGQFQGNMKVALINDGPVTFVLDI